MYKILINLLKKYIYENKLLNYIPKSHRYDDFLK